jgi:hypothetical protein
MVAKLKWACCEEAVTISSPQAHSILNRIGGDIEIVRPLNTVSRKVASCWNAVLNTFRPLDALTSFRADCYIK